MRGIPLLSVVAACAIASPALAATPTPWLNVGGSWATYAMTDANQFVGAFNTMLTGSGITMSKMDEVNNGFGFGVAAGVDLPAGFALGLGYDRLFASTEAPFAAAIPGVGDVSGTLTWKMPANAFRAMAEYRIPTPGPLGARLGVAGGVVSHSGAIEVSVPGEGSESLDMTGTGPLFEGYLSGDWQAAPMLGFVASVGYRYAKVDDVKVEAFGLSETVPGLSVDYSGVLVRLGLKLSLTK